jgi:hypothetical protein
MKAKNICFDNFIHYQLLLCMYIVHCEPDLSVLEINDPLIRSYCRLITSHPLRTISLGNELAMD